MKISFCFDETYKEIYFEQILCFHGDTKSQINIHEIILNGLNGSDKTFLLDNSLIKKKELEVIEFSNNTIIDDLKLNSKSYQLQNLREILLNSEEDHIIMEMNSLLETYQRRLDTRYSHLKEMYPNLFVPDLYVKKIEEVLISNYHVFDKSEITITVSVELQLMNILDYIDHHKDKHFFLLLKHFNHILDLSQRMYILDVIKKMNNITVFIFQNDFDFLCYTENEFTNYYVSEKLVWKCEFSKMNNLETIDILTSSENDTYSHIINYLDLKSKYYQIVSEKKTDFHFENVHK